VETHSVQTSRLQHFLDSRHTDGGEVILTRQPPFTHKNGARSWLRHYATSRKVSSSIPDEVIELFSRTITMESIQPLTEMSTKKLPGGGGKDAAGA
jgi:hypothetical protein